MKARQISRKIWETREIFAILDSLRFDNNYICSYIIIVDLWLLFVTALWFALWLLLSFNFENETSKMFFKLKKNAKILIVWKQISSCLWTQGNMIILKVILWVNVLVKLNSKYSAWFLVRGNKHFHTRNTWAFFRIYGSVNLR